MTQFGRWATSAWQKRTLKAPTALHDHVSVRPVDVAGQELSRQPGGRQRTPSHRHGSEKVCRTSAASVEGIGGGFVDDGQLGVDLRGGELVELAEAGVGMAPPLTCGRLVVSEVVAGAEVSDGADLAVDVADLPEQVECLPVAGNGAGRVAQAQVDFGETRPWGCFVRAVAELLVQGQGLLAQVEGLAVVSQAAVVPAEVGERDGQASLVAQLVEEVVGTAGCAERISLPALDHVGVVPEVVRP